MTNLLKTLLAALILAATFAFASQETAIRLITTQPINASSEAAFDLLRNFERFPEWSPFVVTDPKQKNRVTGKTGQVGSVFHWEGVAEESKGRQTLTALKDGKYLRMECDIVEPFEDQPTFEYQINETVAGVEITQIFELSCSRFSRFMMRLFGVEDEIAATNQLGMARLEALLENRTPLAITE